MTFTQITVNGTYPGATSGASTVTFTPTALMTDGVSSVETTAVVCTLDVSNRIVGPAGQVGAGGFGVVLPATNDPTTTPTGVLYEVMEAIVYGGQTRYRSYAAPLSAVTTPIDVSTLSPSMMPTPTPPILYESIRAKASETTLGVRSLLTTSGAPTSGVGVDGNLAIDPTASKLYGPKSGGVWPGGISYAGTNGTPGSVGSGTLSQRPASAADGQNYPAYDTGLLYAWIAAGAFWMPIGAANPTNLVTSVVPATGPAAVTLTTDGVFYGVPELTTADCTWPAGLVRVSVNDLAFTAAALNKLDVQLAYSLNGGTTWNSLVGTRVTVSDTIGFFARGRQLKPVVSATNVSALTAGVTVRFRVQVARVAGQTLATANVMQGPAFGFPSITVEQVR